MNSRVIEDDLEVSTVLAVMLKELLVKTTGGIREGAERFAYTTPMKDLDTGEEGTFMVTFDHDGNYMVEEVPKGSYPDNSILMLADSKEDAILNAALNGDQFFVKEEPREDPGSN